MRTTDNRNIKIANELLCRVVDNASSEQIFDGEAYYGYIHANLLLDIKYHLEITSEGNLKARKELHAKLKKCLLRVACVLVLCFFLAIAITPNRPLSERLLLTFAYAANYWALIGLYELAKVALHYVKDYKEK